MMHEHKNNCINTIPNPLLFIYLDLNLYGASSKRLIHFDIYFNIYCTFQISMRVPFNLLQYYIKYICFIIVTPTIVASQHKLIAIFSGVIVIVIVLGFIVIVSRCS